MQSLWCDTTAAQYTTALDQRVYTSRLLGKEPSLVLHGGGNTSVKDSVANFFGEVEELILVKGSGWDLATIEGAGFAPVKMDTLMKMAALDDLSDQDMVKYQRAAMTDPSAPNPSVEAILHALIPFKFVDHTHTDAVVTITNTPDGEQKIRDLYGDKVFIIPYVMPGFALAKLVYQMTKDLDWQSLEGMVLLNHGLFTFADDAKTSYEKTIELVTKAEQYLVTHNAQVTVEPQQDPAINHQDLLNLAEIRRQVSQVRGMATIANLNTSDIASYFSKQDIRAIATRGPLTPDHVIRTKRIPALIYDVKDMKAEIKNAIDSYVTQYQGYFASHKQQETCLNPAPNFAIWQNKGSISFGKDIKETLITQDITEHTFAAILTAEKLNGYKALPEQDIFDVEYWSLEQAKLSKTAAIAPLTGQVVLITSACSEIGQKTIALMNSQGASIIAVDQQAAVTEMYNKANCIGCQADDNTIGDAIALAVRSFGGLDIIISDLKLRTLISKAAVFQKLGVNACNIYLDTNLVSTTGQASEIRTNHLNVMPSATAGQVSTMLATLAGATFHHVSNAKIIIGA